MTDTIAIITLALLVIAQLIERYLYSRQMTNKLSECIKAVMSRNINEFITVTAADKAPKQDFIQEESVLMDTLGDEEFDKYIEKQNT